MKGIYLAAYKALHNNYNIIYQDINGKRDIPGDMLNIDLNDYDYIIATPPCNYYSRVNYRREVSIYAQSTKHLLPGILKKLSNINKPFIIENVRSSQINEIIKITPINIFVIQYGRHTYWSNINFNPSYIKQTFDFIKKKNGTYRLNKNTQGGDNVHNVIEYWLYIIHNNYILYGDKPLLIENKI